MTCQSTAPDGITMPTDRRPHAQIWILEKNGGSLVGGALKLFQDRKNNPPPPRNPALPPKPKVCVCVCPCVYMLCVCVFVCVCV